MLGAIAGDIVGSRWANGRCPEQDFTLFSESSDFTGDTVCLIGIADSLVSGSEIGSTLRVWVRRHPTRSYGDWFAVWAKESQRGAYGSYSNGAAMRVASTGWLGASLDEVQALAEKTARLTHDHPEGLRGAKALAAAIWWGRQRVPTEALRQRLIGFSGYPLETSLADYKAGAGASNLAADSVPMALTIALESGSWVETMRNAAAIGGKTETLCSMAGAVAEALYGLPPDVARKTLRYLSSEMVLVVAQVYARAEVPLPWRVPDWTNWRHLMAHVNK